VRDVKVPDDVKDGLVKVRSLLRDQSIELSTRRLRWTLDAVRAHAWLEGRDLADSSDVAVMEHIAWTDPAQRPAVTQAVAQVAYPVLGDILIFADEVTDLSDTVSDVVGLDDKTAQVDATVAVIGRLEAAAGAAAGYLDAATSERERDAATHEFARLEALNGKVYSEVYKLSSWKTLEESIRA